MNATTENENRGLEVLAKGYSSVDALLEAEGVSQDTKKKLETLEKELTSSAASSSPLPQPKVGQP